jgi:hypothetical protein
VQNKKINTIIIIIKTIIRNEVYLYISSCTIVNNIYHVTINFMSFYIVLFHYNKWSTNILNHYIDNLCMPCIANSSLVYMEVYSAW